MKTWDHRLSDMIAERGQSTIWIWKALSRHGMWVFIALAFVLRAVEGISLVILAVTVLSTYAITLMLQSLIRRHRPAHPKLKLLIATYSFPSAHSSASSAFAMALTLASAPFDALAIPVAVTVWTVAFLIAISRIMAGMHYFADVTVGLCLGASIAYAFFTSL